MGTGDLMNPCDDVLVECVGRDNVIKICEQLECGICSRGGTCSCIPWNGHSELCIECYTEVIKQYPGCDESV